MQHDTSTTDTLPLMGWCVLCYDESAHKGGFSMSDEFKAVGYAVIFITGVFFIAPIALTAGLNVAQRIGFVECVAPHVQK